MQANTQGRLAEDAPLLHWETHRARSGKGLEGGSLQAAPLERAALRAVAETLANAPDVLDRVRAHVDRPLEAAAAQPANDRQRFEEERDEIVDRLRESRRLGPAARRALAEEIRRDDHRLEELERELADAGLDLGLPSSDEAVAAVAARLRSLGENLSALPRPEIKRLLREVVFDLEADYQTRTMTFGIVVPPTWLGLRSVGPKYLPAVPSTLRANRPRLGEPLWLARFGCVEPRRRLGVGEEWSMMRLDSVTSSGGASVLDLAYQEDQAHVLIVGDETSETVIQLVL